MDDLENIWKRSSSLSNKHRSHQVDSENKNILKEKRTIQKRETTNDQEVYRKGQATLIIKGLQFQNWRKCF